MRRRDLERAKKRDVAWYLLGLVVVQLGLALGVEQFWPVVRDPEFDELQRILRERRAETPGRPLVLAMGSSRTKWALRVETLNKPDDETAPLVLNWGVNGSGAMLQQTFLRRVLDAGVRPELIFLEVLPMCLSTRSGLPFEEAQLGPWRLTAAEAVRVRGYYLHPLRLDFRWLKARAFPSRIHHAELREVLALDVPLRGRRGFVSGRDRYGWLQPYDAYSQEEVESMTRDSLQSFHAALTEAELAPGALAAVRGMVQFCRDEQIGIVLVIPPESSAFRCYAPTVSEFQVQAVHSLAEELGVPLIDAGAWIGDDGFFDGHHTNLRGADRYTQRFAREGLGPYWSSRVQAHHKTQAVRTVTATSRVPRRGLRRSNPAEAESATSDDAPAAKPEGIESLKRFLCRGFDDCQRGPGLLDPPVPHLQID